MSETLERMQERARELARFGKFGGWRSVAFELQFEPSLKEVFQWLHSASVEDAFQWLHSPKTKEELDRLCDEATTRLLEAFLLLQRSREKDRARILDELSE